ncbi:MAG TPA: hypothetical protein VFT19_07875 [Solirubrobacterales bacterium]|nr:hypothetical protein [Solirubrobacterales bacterium]
MSQSGQKKLPPAPVAFGRQEWIEEVERFEPGAVARARAEGARKEIESGGRKLHWRRCDPESDSGAHLPGCRKLYLPLDAEGASAAPYGFVFQLVKTADNTLIWNFIAFGERHPDNPNTRTVYERAHKRLHGRYP